MSGSLRAFPIGRPVDEREQIGRSGFIDALEERMRAAEKVQVLAGRRTGKTSAARAVAARLRSTGLAAAVVDVAATPRTDEIARSLASQLSPGLARLGAGRQAVSWLADALERAGQATTEGALATVAAALLGDRPTPGGVLARCSEALRGRPALVVFDEAHGIAALRDRFGTSGSAIGPDALELLLAESRCHPFCTMWLARESARIAAPIGSTTVECVEAALAVVRADEQLWALRDAA